MKRPSGALEAALSPLSKIYRGLIQVRNDAYDKGVFQSYKMDVPILSIGNLTTGGTGKTPLTAMLVEEFRNRGKKVGIVSRGYGGLERGPVKVLTDGDEKTARRFGDEPSWLASRFPTIPVYIGADRVAVVAMLTKNHQVDCIISDDGFQHRRLRRSMDVVVLDTTEPRWHYRPLPLGRMREPFMSLRRAQAAILTKSNLANAVDRDYLKRKCSENRVRSFELLAAIPKLVNKKTLEQVEAPSFEGKKVFLVSAIGRPETFEQLVRIETKADVLGHAKFKDHHAYSSSDFSSLEEQAAKLGAEMFVVTEKDAVKMSAWNAELPVFVTCLETRMELGDLKEFYEMAARNLF